MLLGLGLTIAKPGIAQQPTSMAYNIPVYVPNISTDKLMEIFLINLEVESWMVNIERLEKGTVFRAPDLAINMNIDSDQLVVKVVTCLIESARLLGATQFSIKHQGFDMRLRPTNLDAQHIEHLLIASRSFQIDQINIF